MQKVNTDSDITSRSLASSTFYTMSDEVVEAEGFICPYCLVSFATSGKLQSHFVDMHSGHGQVEDEVVAMSNDVEEDTDKTNHTSSSRFGHFFKLARQNRPKACDVCNEIIWHEALVCHSCQMTIHTEKCEAKVERDCEEAVYEPVESPNNEPSRGAPPPQTPKGILPLVRRQVAKPSDGAAVLFEYPRKIIIGRDRYVNEEFDLDLTYITERIIAMSFPASGVESAYRNNLKDVAKMLKTKHQENYMIFNLSERSYDISRFNNQVLDFGWPDHLAPSLERLSSVCKSIKSWLDSDPLHVAVVHCKGGKGRTGCVIAAFMHYSEICHTAAAALDRFAMKRFYDNKLGGVTQPSQRKYVHYFADLLEGKIDLQSPPVVLQHVIMHGIPNFDGKGGCRPFLKIYQNMNLVHTSGLYVCPVDRERVKISIYGGLKLQGEVLLKCYHKRTHTGLDSIFRCQFHSAVIDSNLRLVYSKSDLDDSFKDKRFGDNIKVELIFESWGEGTTGGVNSTDNGVGGADDIRRSLLIGRRSSNTSPNGGGLADLVQQLHDPLATRNSYASFQGGYDNGVSFEEDDHVPDLIVLTSPSGRDRSVSNDSFKMDPNEIEHVTHPQSSQIYTVISKPFKQNERSSKSDATNGSSNQQQQQQQLKPHPPLLKPHLSTGDVIDGPSRNHRDLKSPTPRSVSSSNIRQVPTRPPPPPAKVLNRFSQMSSPTPPPVSTKPTNITAASNQAHSRSTPSPKPPQAPPPSHGLMSQQSSSSNDDAIYSEVPDDLSPSPESNNSPVHQVHKQIKQLSTAKDAAEDRISLSPKHNKPKPKPPPARNKPNITAQPPSDKPAVQYRVAHLGRVGPRKPSYAEIKPDLEIQVEPLPSRTSAVDNDMWVRVKFPTMPPVPQGDGSLGRRSSSSSNLTSTIGSGGDVYSNLADLSINPEELSESQRKDSQRRHSFSEGDSRLVIKATAANRDSIIPVSGGAIDEPEYKNVDYLEDDPANQATIAAMAASKSAYENQRIVSDMMALNMAGMVGEYDPEGDYINQDPEGQFHTYSNHSELLEQMRAEHLPIDDSTSEESSSVKPPSGHSSSSQRQRGGSGASFLKFLKANLIRPKQPTEIHSSTISDEERHKTLAPFEISGINIGRVNRDYEAFFRSESAWGSTTTTPEPSSTSAEGTVQSSLPGQQEQPAAVHNVQGERSDRGGRHPHNQVPPSVAERRGGGGVGMANGKQRPDKPDKPDKPDRVDKPHHKRPDKPDRPDRKQDKPVVADRRPRPEKPERPSHIPPMVPKKQRSREKLNEGGGDKVKSPPSPLPSRKPLRPKPPLPMGRLDNNESHSSSSHAPSPPPSRRPHPPLSKKPSAPTPSTGAPPLPSHSHPKLHATNSDAPVSPRSRHRDKTDHAPSRRKNPPPPKPTPYYIQQQQAASQPIEATVKTLMPYWYKPSITREEAIELVQGLSPGSFIVRDSSTVHGGYALTIKISEQQVRHRKKLSEETVVSEDMLVTHFLIQPDPEGVKLQGWNEKAFKSLPEFISQHTTERMCLPCKLVLPQGAGGGGGGGAHGPVTATRRKPAGMKHALQTGAACDLVYLGSVEVSGPGTDNQLAETVQQLQSLEISSMNIVTFKASRDGITLTDNMNGVYIKRQYPVTCLTYCGLDPEDTRWDFPHLHHLGETITLTNKPCFGVVHIPQDTHGYSCMVFAEFDSAQPVGSVVNFIQKIMKEHRQASRHAVQK